MSSVQCRSTASVCHLSLFYSFTLSCPYVGLPVHMLSVLYNLEAQVWLLVKKEIWTHCSHNPFLAESCMCHWWCAHVNIRLMSLDLMSNDIKSDKSAFYFLACPFKPRWSNFFLKWLSVMSRPGLIMKVIIWAGLGSFHTMFHIWTLGNSFMMSVS